MDPTNCTKDQLLQIINGCILLLRDKYNMNVKNFNLPSESNDSDDNMSMENDDNSSIISNGERRILTGKRKAQTEVSQISTKNRFLPLENDFDSQDMFNTIDNTENKQTQPPNNSQNPTNSMRSSSSSQSNKAQSSHQNQRLEFLKKTSDIPPIILTNKSKWTQISKLFNSNNIKYTKAINMIDGIRILPQTSDDHRAMSKLLSKNDDTPFYTYRLEEEKSLMIVIRNIPCEVECVDVQNDLIDQGFHPTKVTRMINKRTHKPMPLVIVQLPKTEKNIYNIETVAGMVIQIEALKTNNQVVQCFRCQKYGHGQTHCTAEYKCVKCSKNHRAYECDMTKNEKPICANCGENHVASYRGCSKAPKLKKISQPIKTTDKNVSYAQIVQNTQNINENNNHPNLLLKK